MFEWTLWACRRRNKVWQVVNKIGTGGELCEKIGTKCEQSINWNIIRTELEQLLNKIWIDVPTLFCTYFLREHPRIRVQICVLPSYNGQENTNLHLDSRKPRVTDPKSAVTRNPPESESANFLLSQLSFINLVSRPIQSSIAFWFGVVFPRRP